MIVISQFICLPPATRLIQQQLNSERAFRPGQGQEHQRFVLFVCFGIQRARINGGPITRRGAKFIQPLRDLLHDARPAVRHDLGNVLGQSAGKPVVDVIELHPAHHSDRPGILAGQLLQDGFIIAEQLEDADGARRVRCCLNELTLMIAHVEPAD